MVLDASALYAYLLDLPAAGGARTAMARYRPLHAPHLVDTELVSTLRRWLRRGEVSEERADAALAVLERFPLVRHDHARLTHRVWSLRHNFTAYDGTYVALAEVLRTPLLTADARLARAAEPLVDVILV